jgi:hypothetical protein
MYVVSCLLNYFAKIKLLRVTTYLSRQTKQVSNQRFHHFGLNYATSLRQFTRQGTELREKPYLVDLIYFKPKTVNRKVT